MKRFSAIEILSAIATAAALTPVWIFRFFPTQDGPSHLYNSYILSHYSDAASTVIRDYFVLNLKPFPNWTSYAISALLVRVLPPLVVQQIIISLCVISIPAAVLYLQKSFKPAADATALIGVLLAYSYVLFMGFFNFVLGAALFAIAIGFWWRRRDGHYLLGLYPLLLSTFLSHNLAFAATLIAISVLAGIERRWRVLLELSPALLIFLIDAIGRPRGEPLWRPLRWHVRTLVTVFSAGHIAIAFLTLAVILLAIAWAFVRGRPNPFAVISLILFLAYFAAPWSYASAGFMQAGWISERLLYLTILTLPAWIILPWPRATIFALLLAVVAHLWSTTTQIAAIDGFIRNYMQCAPPVRPHSLLKTYFPMTAVSPQVTPTLHLTAYLGLQTDVVDLDDYEADLSDFPVAYRAHMPDRPPDYVVAWKRAELPQMIGYRVVCETATMRLLTHW